MLKVEALISELFYLNRVMKSREALGFCFRRENRQQGPP
jgi:hypothetical protein